MCVRRHIDGRRPFFLCFLLVSIIVLKCVCSIYLHVCFECVCCSVLQCAAICCSVLQCVAVCCSVLQCITVCGSVLQFAVVCYGVLQCAAVCCSVL